MPKQKAIIVDIDGTIADHTNRLEELGVSPHELMMDNEREKLDDYLSKSIDDPVITWCKDLVELYDDKDYQIIFLTGRNESYKEITSEWLNKNLSEKVMYILLMREDEDDRDDAEVKYDIYKADIEPEYDVQFVLDDRDSVVDMFRNKLNIPCLQVTDPEY